MLNQPGTTRAEIEYYPTIDHNTKHSLLRFSNVNMKSPINIPFRKLRLKIVRVKDEATVPCGLQEQFPAGIFILFIPLLYVTSEY